MAELQIELLGGLHITSDGLPLPRLISNKAPALLCYLAITRRAHSRPALATLLWGELPEHDAATNLRTVLASLRRHVGDYLLITRQTVAFNHKACYWLDVDAFQTITQHSLTSTSPDDYQQLQVAVDLYRGDLFEGFVLRGAPLFDEWLLRQRECLRRLAVHGLQLLVDYYSARRDYPLAIDQATRLLAIEPWQEETQRQLMRLYAESGRRSAALVQYELCRRALSAELGIEPDTETTGLYESIRDGRVGALELERPGLPLPVVANSPPTEASLALGEAARHMAEPAVADAERRQVTVLNYGLADMLALSRQLDPEALHDVLLVFRQACNEVVAGFEGWCLSQSANRMLACFGYPVASEDAVARAVHAALGIVQAADRLNQQIQTRYGAQLSVLVGVHTGVAVLGGGVGLIGETPELVGHLLDLDLRDTVVISESTYRLTQGLFSCQMLDDAMLQGGMEVGAYRVLRPSCASSRLEAAVVAGLAPLVGRSQELNILFACWQRVVAGEGQVMLLSGESGIGKSRLVHVLKQRVSDQEGFWMECRCSLFQRHLPLWPVVEMLQRVLGFELDEPLIQRRARLERVLSNHDLILPDTLSVLATLLQLVEPPATLIEQRRTLDALIDALLMLAARQPVLLIVEDVQWADPLTLELISLLIDQGPTAAICTVLTARPEFRPPWSTRSELQTVTLGRLTRYQVELMACLLAGKRKLAKSTLWQIVGRSDGVPLFVEELVKALLSADPDAPAESVGGQGQQTREPDIPASLQGLLMARLDGLGQAKLVGQIGAVIGREFSYQLLRAVAPLDEESLRQELHRLVAAELLYQRGLIPRATFIFRHTLIREVAYCSLLQATRQRYHQRIAQALSASFPDIVQAQPGLLLYHRQALELPETTETAVS